MTIRLFTVAALMGATALISACNDDNSPRSAAPIVTTPTQPPVTPRTMTISEYVSSLIAMVMGSSCDTATPAALDGVTLDDDMTAQDANAIAVNCSG